MKCKITRNAATALRRELDKPENADLMVRVVIAHKHGNHAHYGLELDKPTDEDEVVSTDKGIDVLLPKGEDQDLLDGVKIDYFYLPQEGFAITNPSKGNHGDH
ncbi:HesB/IscA family protein [Cohnella faecalis]|uniref:Iron-sulfur cluster assembly accessory protein n=1 Tax=Cohnella faecalis TaxID=2315694 RepID=A0A398CUS1_9BACL|nr:iron-sulfur cluster assembly accessory protein [Cohnella faecalis]RIE03041.1 iron-sulfur cluster assembly accessory protein [Cohnella faecalis]